MYPVPRKPTAQSSVGRRLSSRSKAFTLFAICATVTLVNCSPGLQTQGTVTVVDEIGRTIRVPVHPKRIVSLAPSVTEMLFALGLNDRIVGVTSYCDYPPEATEKEKVGDTLRPGVERIIGLRSDLVVASTSSQVEQFVYRLEQAGVPVYASNPRSVDDVLESLIKLGGITGREGRAKELTREFRSRLDTVARQIDAADRPRVLFLLGVGPLITIGRHTFIDDIINRAGGESVTKDLETDYPQYSLESAVASRPEVIFLQSGDTDLPNRLKQTPAGVSGRVYHLDDALLLRPGPRVIDGVEKMAACLHPQLFPESVGNNR